MSEHSFYHKETGVLHPKKFTTDDPTQLANNIPPDHAAIDGHHDHLSKRVDLATKEVVEWMPIPPSTGHVWNPETLRWQLTAAALEKIAASAKARNRIAELEASQHRLVREHIIGKPDALAKLQAIDDEIFALRPLIL
jgi:sugar phosphate isomerase/epimerase